MAPDTHTNPIVSRVVSVSLRVDNASVLRAEFFLPISYCHLFECIAQDVLCASFAEDLICKRDNEPVYTLHKTHQPSEPIHEGKLVLTQL